MFDSTTKKSDLESYCKANGIKSSGLSKERLLGYVQGVIEERRRGMGEPVYLSADDVKLHPVYANPNLDFVTHLNSHGWCVVPIEGWNDYNFVDMFYTHLERCSPKFRRDDRVTWKSVNMPFLLHGIIKHHIAQTEMCWKIRELCAPIFGKIYNTPVTDLISSMDGGGILWNRKGVKKSYHLHTDWSRGDTFPFVQGIANFLDCGESSGGLVLLENSHTVFDDYMNYRPSTGYRWEATDFSFPGYKDKRLLKICAKRGELVLWNSKCCHANTKPSNNDVRMVTYVSMQLRSWATQKELNKAVEAYTNGLHTNHSRLGHWFDVLGKNPYMYGGEVVRPEVLEIALANTELRRRLIGY